MQRIKLFKSVETELAALEQEINAWLEQSGARITHVHGNIAPQTAGARQTAGTTTRAFDASDIFVAILYETE